jgi:RND family efflux transporter MFP subunit
MNPSQPSFLSPSLLVRHAGWLLALALLAACGNKEAEKQSVATNATPTDTARAALTVALISPSAAPITRSIQADGNISAWQEANVGAEMMGRIESVKVQVGDKVKRYQELARFSTSIESADHGQMVAAAAQANATYAEAKAAAERAHKLKDQGFMGEQMLTQYDTQAATAKARMEQANAARDANALRLANGVVRATADGTISRVNAVAGSIVPAGTELFRLIQDGRLEWRAQVTAAEMNRIQPGMKASVSLGDGLHLAGKVRSIAPTVDAQNRTGLVYVDLDPSAYARAGMYVGGQIESGQSTAFLLPQTAVVLRDGFSYVMQVDETNRIKQTVVQLGQRQGEQIEILSGLPPQARVVASGAAFLNEGDKVRIATSDETPAPTMPTTALTAVPAKADATSAAQ